MGLSCSSTVPLSTALILWHTWRWTWFNRLPLNSPSPCLPRWIRGTDAKILWPDALPVTNQQEWLTGLHYSKTPKQRKGCPSSPFMLAFRHTSAGVLYSLSPFWRPFSRWTWVSRCLLKQRMMEVVSGDKWNIGAIIRANLQSNHHHQQTNIQFFTGRMPFLSPNQQCQSTEGENITFHGLAHPKLTGGSSNFVSDH